MYILEFHLEEVWINYLYEEFSFILFILVHSIEEKIKKKHQNIIYETDRVICNISALYAQTHILEEDINNIF